MGKIQFIINFRASCLLIKNRPLFQPITFQIKTELFYQHTLYMCFTWVVGLFFFWQFLPSAFQYCCFVDLPVPFMMLRGAVSFNCLFSNYLTCMIYIYKTSKLIYKQYLQTFIKTENCLKYVIYVHVCSCGLIQ